MAPSSTFYFNSNAYPADRREDLIREIPTYAVHALNSSYNSGWESNSVQSKAGFERLVSKINPMVRVHLAMPRVIANKHFSVGTSYPKLAIQTFKPVPSMSWSQYGYMAVDGEFIQLILEDLMVASVTTINQWAGLPALKDSQVKYLEKLLGKQQMYDAVAVKLGVRSGDVVG